MIEIVHIPIESIVPYARNPRVHSDEQIQAIIGSMQEFGFTNPILIDEKNVVIAGHGRLVAATRLGMKSVPCVIIAGLDENKKRALTIIDNRIAEMGTSWDNELLELELAELDMGKLTAIPEDFLRLDELLSRIKAEKEAPLEFPNPDDMTTEHCCPKCGYRWSGESA